jgi:alpha-glucosidase (family GH31 glycosyl hydrolase)
MGLLEYQYCFGSALLVAPVVEDRQRRQSVYLPVLPEGEEWLDLGSSFVYDLV